MNKEHLTVVNWIDNETQKKVVQKFIKKELTPEQFKEALENSLVIIKEMLNNDINIKLDLE